jgi:chitodextrinase
MRISRSMLAVALLIALVATTAPPVRAAIVERGPYLQQVTSNSITVRWRTDSLTDAVVRYGPAPDDLVFTAVGSQSGTEHEVNVSGLAPGSLYYYSIGNSAGTLAGGDTSFRFLTAPAAGASSTTRVWVIGDSGTANSSARAVRDAYIGYAGNEPADIWLMLGDNAYDDGTDSEYQSAVFDTYPTILRNTPLWTTLGNHDGHSADSNSEQGPYYDIFTMPRNAEAGGLASGTEAYYSFDYGNIHFVTLDSYETDRSPDGAMLTWLENDLAATNKEWLIAFWHHPPYSKGSHNSDSSSESQMRDMRERALPILESYGVDLVLTGHSHSYERSTLIDGHYGLSNTFDPASMEIDGGSGREDETGAYNKPVAGNAHQGTVYAVAGSSGKTSAGPLDHPIMFISLQTLGSMMLDINDGRLDAVFIDSAGTRRDYFTIEKEAPPVDSDPPTTPANLAVTNIAQSSLTLSWQAASDNVGVTGYRISRDGTVLTTTTALSYDDSGLTAATRGHAVQLLGGRPGRRRQCLGTGHGVRNHGDSAGCRSADDASQFDRKRVYLDQRDADVGGRKRQCGRHRLSHFTRWHGAHHDHGTEL